MTEPFVDSRTFAEELDGVDPLAAFRQRFKFPTWRDGRSPIYLCGNSLGLQSDLARTYVEQELDAWSTYAVDGHFNSERPWMSYHRLAAGGFAELTGAKESEVIAMNTLTVNLHLLMAGFYRPSASALSSRKRRSRRIDMPRHRRWHLPGSMPMTALSNGDHAAVTANCLSKTSRVF